MMMAGLDGIKNKIDPGNARTRTCTSCRRKRRRTFPKSAHSLDMERSIISTRDRDFLKRGGVFSDDLIDAYIGLKQGEVTRFRMSTTR